MLALAAGVWIRAPRLDHSFWNDEEYSVRRFAHGNWEQRKDGEWRFHAVTWDDTLFECRNGNNHHMNSILTRWSQEVWRFASGQPRAAFSEAASRVPAFLAGALTIVLVFMLGVEISETWVGIGAAWLLALHPWHVRYAVEQRGYSSMLLFLCLSLIGLVRALRTDKYSDWLCFAVGVAGCLLNFAGALYAVAAVNVAASVELLIRKEPRRLATLIGFNLLAAIPVAIWVFPSVPQILHLLVHDPARYGPGVGWHWGMDLITHLLAGIHSDLPEPEVHRGTTLLAQHEASLFSTIYLGFFLVLVVAGMVAALRTNAAARIAVVAPLAVGIIVAVQSAITNGALLIWYMIYMLISLVLVVPLVLARLLSFRPALIAPAVALVVVGYAVATADMRGRLVRFDRQPMRQTVEFIREASPEAMTAVLGVSDRQTQSYDPRVRILKHETDLDKAIADANTEGRQLYVYFCGRTESRRRVPELMRRLLDETAFQRVATFPGLEAMFSYEIWQLRPATPRGPGGEARG